MFRTCPELEKDKLVFQLGTASPELAVQAAKVVARDVSAIDVNSGCPKHFSIHSGMGAALLRTPDKLVNILTALVTEVGIPFGIAISVKIRLLESEAKTVELVQLLVKTGITNLTLHCRTTPMRPREPAIRDDGQLAKVAAICKQAGVSCLVNGDVEGRVPDLADLRAKYGVDGAMIARAAEANPSCFSETPVPWYTIVHEYFDICKQYSNHPVNTKFCLARMIPGKATVYQKVASAKTMEAIAEALKGATKEADDNLPRKGPSPSETAVIVAAAAAATSPVVSSAAPTTATTATTDATTDVTTSTTTAPATAVPTVATPTTPETDTTDTNTKRQVSPPASPDSKRLHISTPSSTTASAF